MSMAARHSGPLPEWYKPEPNEERDKELAARQEKRAAIAASRVRVEELRQKGHAAYAKGSYLMAKEYYNQAYSGALGHRVIQSVLLDLARTYLKLNSPEAAERLASSALLFNAKNVQARCVRGNARTVQRRFCAAITDFDIALQLDPANYEAKHGRRTANTERYNARKMRPNGDDEFPGHEADNEPRILSKIEPLRKNKFYDGDASDTSDYNHEGNGMPCRRYNESRCAYGSSCNYSHAPTKWTVRDQLGRNVCLSFIFGYCKQGLEQCYYSHSTAYLAPTAGPDGEPVKWWTRPDLLCNWRRLKEYSPAASRALHRDMLWDRRAQNRACKDVGAGPGLESYVHVPPKRRKGNDDWDEDDDWSSEDDLNGYGKDAYNELLSQGIKPWDDGSS